jgi:hypothetical protein
MINGEEWPPYVKDANVTMYYPTNVPDDKKFAIGHPFFSLLPGLFMYATIWLREHNRVCGILRKEHPHWEDERIFQTAKLVITGKAGIPVTTCNNYGEDTVLSPQPTNFYLGPSLNVMVCHSQVSLSRL